MVGPIAASLLPRRVGARLALAFGLLAGMLLLVAGVGMLRLDRLNRDFATIVIDRHTRVETLSQITDAQQAMMRGVGRILLVDDAARIRHELALIGESRSLVAERLEQLDKAFEHEDARGKALLAEARGRNTAFLANLDRFGELASAGRREEARKLLEPMEAQLDEAYGAMTIVGKAQVALMQAAQQEAQRSYEQARAFVLAVSLGAIALALAIAVAITRGVSRPLGAAARLAGAVADGDLTGRVDAQGSEETVRLLHALSRMTESLTGIVGRVRGCSESIAAAAGELVTGNAELLRRAEQEAAALEETAATLEELTATVRANAEHAREASELARSASDSALRSGEAVDRAVKRMGAVTDASRKIGEVTRLINDIAFQTNLLALNAAVEAARAGDQGKGFAVVAAEVRALAQRSAAAATQIGALIRGASSEVEGGAKLVEEAGRAMNEVVGSIRSAAQLSADIAASSREQSEAIEQVNRALAAVDQVTQGNVALAGRTAGAVRSLEQQAGELVDSVGVFRLDESGHAQAARSAPAAPRKRKGRAVAALSLDAAEGGDLTAAAR